MKYLKFFENYLDIDDLMVDLFDKPGKYKIVKDSENVIDIEIIKKNITSENRRRCIYGYFRKGNSPKVVNNNPGYVYEYMYKSKDTIEIITDVEDLCMKIVNFSKYDYCYFHLSGMKLRISLGSERFRRLFSNYHDFDDEYIKRNWGL